ncbi:MAG: SCP2 sterol-binding domain-containing protein [Bacteroidota bacterium]
MDKSALLAGINEQAKKAAPIGGTIKFDLDGNMVFIDGSGGENVVTEEDKEADCTIKTSMETLLKLQRGELNPMMATMTGKVKIKGDMGLAMKLQSLLG